MSHFDIAIVGLGAMGSASLYQLAKSGAKVVGIDRFAPPHAHGSTHGETRITRCAIGEGEALVPLALRSHEIWREIEAETGADLLRQTGSLIISKPDDTAQRPGRTGFLDRSIAAARRFGIDHEVLSSADIRRRFPNFQPDDDEIGYFEPGGGYLRVEACVAANLELAQRHGATLQLGCTVQSIEADGAGVHIRTDQGDVLADRVAVSVGAWAGQLLGPPFEAVLKPTRQVMHWFEIEPKSLDAWRHSPVFMWPHGDREDGFFYGFPSIDGVSMKTADEYYGAAADPDAIDREVAPAESERLYREHLAGRFAGLTARALRTATCIYTATPDSGFVIDWHPRLANVLAVSPCSGHGFKHSAAIGEAVCSMLLGQGNAFDVAPFALDRFFE